MAGIINDSNKLGGVPQSASRHVAMSTCYDIWLEDPHILIGFINQVTIAHTRTVTQIRHLNSVDAGIAVDTVVTPDAPTLTFNGFYVYKAEEGKALLNIGDPSAEISQSNEGVGPSMGRLTGVALLMTLDQQRIPFSIIVRHKSNNISHDEKGTIIGVYKNSTIASMSIPINVGTAAVADTGNISVGYVASSPASTS